MDESRAVKIDVGDFLGMGEHWAVVPYEKLKFVNQAVASTTATQARASLTDRRPHHARQRGVTIIEIAAPQACRQSPICLGLQIRMEALLVDLTKTR